MTCGQLPISGDKIDDGAGEPADPRAWEAGLKESLKPLLLSLNYPVSTGYWKPLKIKERIKWG
jgi:hypothetical protein